MSAGKLFKLAMMSEADNQDKAIKYYKKIINDFPEDEYAIRAKNRLDNIQNSTLSIGKYLEKHEESNEEIKKVILTTSNFLEGYKVEETIEIVTAECVYGINFFSDFFTGLSDFFGGRSQTTQKVLRDARRVWLYELKKEAHLVGANAVIAVDLDYSEFTGKGKSMLFLVASGTAVKVSKCL